MSTSGTKQILCNGRFMIASSVRSGIYAPEIRRLSENFVSLESRILFSLVLGAGRVTSTRTEKLVGQFKPNEIAIQGEYTAALRIRHAIRLEGKAPMAATIHGYSLRLTRMLRTTVHRGPED